MADPVLFLHIVPFIAAVATLPHRNADSKLYRIVLNSLLRAVFLGLSLWLLCLSLPVLALECHGRQLCSRFDILYLAENSILVLAAVF